MKKAILFFTLLSLFFASIGFTMSLNHKDNTFSYKNYKSIINSVKFSKTIASDSHIDLIEELDSENDDDQFNSLSDTNKNSVATIVSLNNAVEQLETISKKTNTKSYFAHNFSRIPRFNFLSLRVLRL